MPTAPALTAEQRQTARERSLELRRQRAEVKALLGKAGPNERLADILTLELSWVQGMKVLSLLLALPGIGKVKAQAMLASAGIPERNTVAMCGPRQLERLFKILEG